MLLELRFSICTLGLGAGTFLAALYGMNLKNFMEESDLGFWGVSAFSAIISGIVLMYGLRVLRRVQRVSMWGHCEPERGGMGRARNVLPPLSPLPPLPLKVKEKVPPVGIGGAAEVVRAERKRVAEKGHHYWPGQHQHQHQHHSHGHGPQARRRKMLQNATAGSETTPIAGEGGPGNTPSGLGAKPSGGNTLD
jgi:hypothetical protein